MKIEDILKIETDLADIENWGGWPIRTIKRNFELTINGLPHIREFLLDYIDYLQEAIEFQSKWAGIVYHENASIAKGWELKVAQQIIVNIGKFERD